MAMQLVPTLNFIERVSSFFSVRTVNNVSPSDQDKAKPLTNRAEKKKTCPMSKGKPFVGHYMDDMLDELSDNDWDIDVFKW